VNEILTEVYDIFGVARLIFVTRMRTIGANKHQP
jgi:hypothetical protein